MTIRQHKGYSSIPNALRGPKFAKIASSPLVDPSVTWVATEKLHGANLCMVAQRFSCGKVEMYCCRRNDVLLETERFYNAYSLLRRYESALINVLNEVHGSGQKPCKVFVYGELIGGRYPGAPSGDWETLHEGKPKIVQQGIYYCPHNEFVSFDVFNGVSFIEFLTAKSILEKAGFLAAEILHEGTFDTLLALDPDFQTTFPRRLGLPDAEDNVAEGYVLRPVRVASFSTRALLKLKSKRFSEISSRSAPRVKVPRPCGGEVPFTAELNAALDELARYITTNRLDNVVSKVGKGNASESKLANLLALDALEEFNDDHLLMVKAMKRPQQKKFRRLAVTMAEEAMPQLSAAH